MNNDLNDFMNDQEKVSASLLMETLKLTQISLNPKALLIKFFVLNILGALATLSICPQYGFGPFAFSAGIMHVIMSYGPVVCGVFCAGIFFLGGHCLSYVCLSSPERKWMVRHGYALAIPYVSFIFMIGMGLRNLAPGHVHHDVFAYYLSWLVTAIFVSILFLKAIAFGSVFSRAR